MLLGVFVLYISYPGVQDGMDLKCSRGRVYANQWVRCGYQFLEERAFVARKSNNGVKPADQLQKAPTGIAGLDEITLGGLPRGRPTLVCGAAGCGKTLLAMEFLVRGATQYGEPGVFMAFEETPDELSQNVASLGFDLRALERKKKLSLDHVHIERSEIQETGEYDLEGLFVRLNYAIDSIGAKRVVLDTLEALFGGLSDTGILRAELRRLFRWLKDKGVTAVITAERGDGSLTRHGLEEYVSDCVILLDNRVQDQLTTRRLRIVKYRGTSHGTNEYPFLIDEDGFSVTPITSVGLGYSVSSKRISTGISELDDMLGGGYYQGSSVLVSGTAGTGKTSIAAHLVNAACARGERAIFLASEESPQQIIRNMASIGIDLGRWLDRGLLRFHAERATAHGFEAHLTALHKHINNYKPQVAVIDPLNTLLKAGAENEVENLIVRMVDFLKSRGVTALFSSIADFQMNSEHTDIAVSSLVDTWLLVRNIEQRGERNRGLYVLKSRGMAHSNQIREFLMTNQGIKLVDVCVDDREGVLIGSARKEFERAQATAAEQNTRENSRKRFIMEQRRKALAAKIEALQSEFEAQVREDEQLILEAEQEMENARTDRAAAARERQSSATKSRRSKNGSRRS